MIKKEIVDKDNFILYPDNRSFYALFCSSTLVSVLDDDAYHYLAGYAEMFYPLFGNSHKLEDSKWKGYQTESELKEIIRKHILKD